MYRELDNDARRMLIDAQQAFEALREAEAQAAHYKGSMSWKQVNGGTYLIKQNHRGNQTSLGPRSESTERLLADFHEGRSDAKSRLESLRAESQRHARLIRAIGMNRLPAVVGSLLRRLSRTTGKNDAVTIVGTNALYAYEALAGVRFDSGSIATSDVDLLWDSRKKISLGGSQGLMGLLQRVDPTFRRAQAEHGYRAVNNKGYMVDLVEGMTRNVMVELIHRMSELDDDLTAVSVKGLEWILSCPRVAATVFDEKGRPVPMTVPDPRAFALHKHWLSSQPDRDPLKRDRDASQATTVAQLVINHFPAKPFSGRDLQALPASIREANLSHDGMIGHRPDSHSLSW